MSYQKLEQVFRKYNQLNNIKDILSWDSSVMMPKAGQDKRVGQMLLLSEYGQEILQRQKIEQLLCAAKEEQLNLWQQANLQNITHYIAHKFAIPQKLESEFMQAGLECEFFWREARKANDFKNFAPKLEKVIKLLREIAFLKAERLNLSPYDALLDEYEPGLRVSDFAPIFAQLKAKLPDLIANIKAKQPKVKIDYNNLSIPVARQREFCQYLARKLGFSADYSRIDEAVHPFCGGYKDDVRITTRYHENGFLESLMGIIHETGHGIYESNLPAEYSLDLVGQALGMAVHESQSLFYEMQIGRLASFCEFLVKEFKEFFPDIKELHDAENLWHNFNQVTPGLIRVNADEVTYPLHIILRYEIEESLINKEIEVADLPEIWNQKMKDYLGVKVPNDQDGCMQDIHWTDGSLGYFPTYSLGAIIAANIAKKARNAIVDFDAKISQGEFNPINNFLKDNLHQYGSLLPARERISNICGEFLNADIFLNYLQQKYLA